MKATQLEQMREDFIYIKTTKNLTEDKVEQHSEVCICVAEMGSSDIITFLEFKPFYLDCTAKFCFKASFNINLWSFLVLERPKTEVPGEGGPLQEPGFTWWNAHQTGGVAEADGLGFGEIIFLQLPAIFQYFPFPI